MPQYQAKDAQTGKTVTFEWHGDGEPTDADMEEVFAAAGSQEPKMAPLEQIAADHARSKGMEPNETEQRMYRSMGDGSGLIGGGVKVVGEKALGIGEKIARRRASRKVSAARTK
jgi:hypothetical protein